MSDPGGFPAASVGGEDGAGGTPEPSTALSAFEARATPDRPAQARAIDPWGETGPVDQAAADAPLTTAQRVELMRFPTFGDPTLAPIEFADGYARLAATVAAQLEFCDALIAQEVGRAGSGGGLDAIRVKEMEVVMGHRAEDEPEAVETGKQSLTALIQWQGQLQTRLEVMLRNGVKMAIKAHQADTMRRYGTWIATTLEAFSVEVGVDWDHESTRRAAQRAVLATRATLQVGATSPDAAGPRLTADERAAVRRTG